MADAAAKREARRRRILENSEYRLQKITGQVNHNHPTGERSNSPIEKGTATSSSKMNGILASEAFVESQYDDPFLESDLIEELQNSMTRSTVQTPDEHDIFTLLSSQNVPYRRGLGTRANTHSENGNAGHAVHNTTNTSIFSTERHEFLDDSVVEGAERDTTTLNPIREEESLLGSMLNSLLVYVILAVVVNVMIIFNMEQLFGTSIVIPFFVLATLRLCVCRNDRESRSNNMFIAALILSNIRPDFVNVIHRLKGAISLFSKIFKDFAIYLFSFVMIHTVLCRYWSNLDVTLPEDIFVDTATM